MLIITEKLNFIANLTDGSAFKAMLLYDMLLIYYLKVSFSPIRGYLYKMIIMTFKSINKSRA